MILRRVGLSRSSNSRTGHILAATNRSRERGMCAYVACMTCAVSHHCPILPSLREGAQSTSLDEMLGNQGVTESNMMQYLGESKVQRISLISCDSSCTVLSYAPFRSYQASSNKEQARYCKRMQLLSQGSRTARATSSNCPHPTSSQLSVEAITSARILTPVR
jgi:hypothetical protein